MALTVRKATKWIAIHASDTPADADIGAAEIDAWHRAAPREWGGVGYHLIIRRNGRVEPGRPLWAVGAHVSGHNAASVGICLIGGKGSDGKPEDNFTPAQKITLHGLLTVLTQFFPGVGIQGHRDFSPDTDKDGVVEPHEWLKTCPCFDVRAWLGRFPLPGPIVS